jgi:hypothetical protein
VCEQIYKKCKLEEVLEATKSACLGGTGAADSDAAEVVKIHGLIFLPRASDITYLSTIFEDRFGERHEQIRDEEV